MDNLSDNESFDYDELIKLIYQLGKNKNNPILKDLLLFRINRFNACLACLCKEQQEPTNDHFVDKDLQHLFPNECRYCPKKENILTLDDPTPLDETSSSEKILTWDDPTPWDETSP